MMNNLVSYVIIHLLNGSDMNIEVPHTWLTVYDKPVKIKNLHIGALYYCGRYKSGCEIVDIL